MIITTTKEPELIEFQNLVYKTNESLNSDAKSRELYYLTRTGTKLEEDVYQKINDLSKGTPFDNKIELISGIKFPDIVAKKLCGIEVKSSIQNHWTTPGNSILESNRISGVERIFLLFGKLAKPIEFKCRSYEECLSEIRVTHSPRYMIDMNLTTGNTIFDKLQLNYDELRQQNNPIETIIKYYKANLKNGESLWWVDNIPTSPITVRLWYSLSKKEKISYIIKGIVYYPEIFGKNNKKYDRFTLDLVTKYGIISTSMRDSFTAGGKQDITTNKGLFKKLPKIYDLVNDYVTQIIEEICSADPILLEKHWNMQLSNDRIKDWIGLVSDYSDNKQIKLFLNAIIIK